MMENTPQPFQAFCHVGAFLRARGMRAATPGDLPETMPECGKFMETLVRRGVRRIVAHDADDERYLVLFILAPGGKYATSGPELGNLLNTLVAEPYSKTGRLEEVIVLLPPAIYAGKRNITGVLVNYQRAANAPGRTWGKYTAMASVYSAFAYDLLLVNLFEACAVVPHAIMAPAAARALTNWYCLEEKTRDLPWISDIDPVVVWLGARPGQFIQINRPSRETSVSLTYRLVRATRKR